MSNKLMKLVWECNCLPDPTDTLVMLRLAWYAVDSGACFSSICELAQVTRHSERTVQRSLTRLERDGWISADRAGGRGKAPQFVLNIPRLKENQFQTEKGDAGDTVSEPSTPGKDVVHVTLSEFEGDENDDTEGTKGCHGRRERVTSKAGKGDMGVTPSNKHQKEPSKASFLQSKPAIEKADPRHAPFRDLYLSWFKSINGIEDKWNGMEGVFLSRFLREHPDATVEHLEMILANRQRSPVNLSQSFCDWFAGATRWLRGPADPFGNPPREKFTTKEERVSESIRRVFENSVSSHSLVEGELAEDKGPTLLSAQSSSAAH